MRLLFIGDIVGRPGRNAVQSLLPDLRKTLNVDWVIANGENLSGGKGMSPGHARDLQSAGVDVFTSGNHIWAQSGIYETLEKPDSFVLRPANYPAGNPGVGARTFTNARGQTLLVINLIGRVFMKDDVECPFKTLDRLLETHAGSKAKPKQDAIFVDFHAEATSEKVVLGHYAAGRISALVGTHTHVPTADERILEGDTAYLTDAGFVGLRDSAIGVDIESVLNNFLTQMPARHTITPGAPVSFNSVLIDVNDEGHATAIERVTRVWDPSTK